MVIDARELRAAAASALAQRFPARWLEEHALLPLSVHDGVATVAADGAVADHVRDALERHLDATVQWVHVARGDVRAALLAAPRVSAAASAIGSTHGDDATESLDDLRAQASREPVVQVVNAMLAEAVRGGASDVHLESMPDALRVRMRLDGVLHDAQQLGVEFKAAVISRLKVLAGLDIAERRLPQDGRARVRVGDREVDVRVSTLPALHGESVVLRLLDGGSDTHPETLAGLGFTPALLSQLRTLVQRSAGLVLVTGPTGSGKTTTLYSALRERSTPGVKVVTVEDPVEYRLDGVVQLPVQLKAGFGFPDALRAILRHDPDVILVGEMRDAETAEIAVRAALTGHLVLSTVHTTDAVGALARLRDMGVPPYLLAATLQGVTAQRLVRRTCAACGELRAPSAADQALFGATGAPSQVRVGTGCAVCNGTGYRGRVAIAELLVMTDALRDALIQGASIQMLRTLSRTSGAASLLDDGRRAVRDGITTSTEIARVLGDIDGSWSTPYNEDRA